MIPDRYISKNVCILPGLLEKAWYELATVNSVDSRVLRPEIAHSWRRCLTRNVNPLERISAEVQGDLREKIEHNQLLYSVASRYMEKMYEDIRGKGYIVMLTDAEGVILSLFGDRKMYGVAESLSVVSGSSNAEALVGTTAPGIARIRKMPIQVRAHEHYAQCYHDWYCSAAPILDRQGEVIGCLNISNMNQKAHPAAMLSLVQMTVRAIEMEMNYRVLHDAYRESSFSFNGIVDSLQDALVFLKQEENTVYLNKKAQDLFGTKRREFPADQFGALAPRFDTCANQLKSGQHWHDLQLVTPHGRVDVEAHLQLLRNDRAEQLGIVGLLKEKPGDVRNLPTTRYSFDDFIYRSPRIAALLAKAAQIATRDITVLIQGESGTGKEIIAQAMHRGSARRNRPFVAVNSAALPRELILSELFGYEEGTFTGASKGGRAGKFEQAHGGTLFLDEIGDMSLEAQASLLRVLQEKQIVRLGGSRPIAVDVRVIAATNKDLRQEVRAARFREDLYYRLAVINLLIPPLRERREDIEPLLEHLLSKLTPQLRQGVFRVSREAKAALLRYSWPGNVRELENVVLAMSCAVEGGCIDTDALPDELRTERRADKAHTTPRAEDSLRSVEIQTIESALRQCGNNISKTAQLLGINRATLYRKMEKYQLRVR